MRYISKTSHFLGIDLGQAKVGLAMADSETKIAFSYGTVANDKNLFEILRSIIEKENVEKVVIGVTAWFKNENNGKSVRVQEDFSEKIKAEFPGISIEFQNEMFTTISAQNNLIEKGEREVGKKDDAESARIILQEWLERSF